jgi:hypothetical protein
MLYGVKIKKIRKMTKGEAKKEGWNIHPETQTYPFVVIEMENGIKLFPSADEEGNWVGAIFGETRKGKKFVLLPHQRMGKRLIEVV